MAIGDSFDWTSYGGDYSYTPTTFDPGVNDFLYSDPAVQASLYTGTPLPSMYEGMGQTQSQLSPSLQQQIQAIQNAPTDNTNYNSGTTNSPTLTDSLAKALLGGGLGVLGSYLSSSSYKPTTGGYTPKDPNAAAREAQLAAEYPQLYSQIQGLTSQPAISPYLESAYLQQVLPLIGTQTPEDKTYQQYLRSIMTLPQDYFIDKSQYADAKNRLQQAASNLSPVTLGELAPGSAYAGSALKGQIEKEMNANAAIQSQIGNIDIQQAQAEAQARQLLALLQGQAGQMGQQQYGTVGQANTASQMLNYGNLTNTAQQNKTAADIARQLQAMQGQGSYNIQAATQPGVGAYVGNPLAASIGQGVTGAAQQMAYTNAPATQGQSPWASMLSTLIGSSNKG